MKVTHIYRGNASMSSRIAAQLNIDKGKVLDNVSFFDFAVIFKVLFKSSRRDVFVFHQQACIVNLVFCVFLCFLFRKVTLVYDIHDILEYKKHTTLRGKVSFFVYSVLEKIIFYSDVRLLTVSDGLSRIYYLKHKRKPKVFYNIPPSDFYSNSKLNNNKSKHGKCIYFGQINEVRLPLELLNSFKSKGISIDVYGIFNSDLSYIKEFNKLEGDNVVNYLGEYDPSKIVELVSNYSYSLLYFPSNRVNLRFCLPNKLFQSFSANVRCVISDNLSEIKIKFSDCGGVLYVSDLNAIGNENVKNEHNIMNKINAMQNRSIATYKSIVHV